MALHHMLRAAAGSAGSSDPYFEYNTLLLTGDGTNGAQNNTFLDSSTNNFTITRNGNTTQGTFSPYGNLWSNYFDGTGDYLAINFASGSTISGDFTWETWVYDTGITAYGSPLGWRTSGTSWQGFIVARDNGTNNVLAALNGTLTLSQTTGTYLKNTWNHLALVRSGTTVTLYVNGVSVSSGTLSGSFNPGSAYWIGSDPYNNIAAAQLGGYISNQRFVNGTALYTSNFTPSTTPLTAVSGTSLLTCQSNRFIDNSSNNFTLTVNGNTSVQRFSPFNPTAPYSASTIGGSGYFDGNGDYLTVPADTAFNIGTNSFTTEFWHYKTSAAALQILFGINIQTSSGYAAVRLISNTDNTFTLNMSSTGSSWVVNTTSTATISLNSWNHIAIVRNGSAINLYLNGISIISATSSASLYVGNINVIGANVDGSGYGAFTFGYISNFRFVNGTAVYTSSFTPPTSPLTAVSGTSLLCNFTNAGIPDAAMMNNLETVGNAQVSTSVVKYGTGSLAFDGTGDWLLSPSSPNFAFGTGDFTVECWINTPTTNSNNGILQISTTVGGFQANTTGNIVIQISSTNVGIYANNTSYTTTNTPFTVNAWNHVALVRSSGVLSIYVNGTKNTTVGVSGNITDTTDYSGTNLVVGGYYSTSYLLNGYIDDLRITKGYARYTANFTPPTAALPTY